ncbi:MAG: FAD:protein FMN transferase [Coriobacteriales bacterium]
MGEERVVDPIPYEERYSFEVAAAADAPHCLEFLAFNTFARLSAYGPLEQVEPALLAARDACRRYERLFSKTLPHSEVAQLNAASGAAVCISQETYELLEGSIAFCQRSQGCFDITLEPVLRLWDYKNGVVPSRQSVAHALQHVGWELLELGGEPGERWARLADPYAAVDVGGTAKGYIADRLCEQLGAAGLHSFVVNLGGNIAVRGGRPDGIPFSIGIRDPHAADQTLASVQLFDGSVVTSGLTERCFTASDGTRYTHIISPRTGWPIAPDAESATIVAASSFAADGYSTTLCSLGIKAGLAFASACKDIQLAVFVDKNGELTSTAALR